jgi:tRNA(Arg) A34 adenosine deaminase TadA
MCAGALARSGIGQVVFALSTSQLNGLKTSGGFADVPTDGPYLYDEAKVPVEGYYP